MHKVLILLIFSMCVFAKNVNAQEVIGKTNPADSGYVNKGKIAGKKAVRRSLIFPGLGQIYNYGLVVDDVKSGYYGDKRVWQKMYIIGKIGAIYGGGYVLVSSYIDNNNNYKKFLKELQYRSENGDVPDPDGDFTQYTNTSSLVIQKNIYKNNREVVLLSLGVLYFANVVDAYVTARLKYHNVTERLSYQITPTVVNSGSMYGFVPAPGLKVTLKL